MPKFYRTFRLFLLLAVLLTSACSEKDDLNGLNSDEKAFLSDSNYVSLKQATIVASSTIRNNSSGKLTLNIKNAEKRVIDKQKTVVDASGANAYYIITYKGGGFVVLSADRRTSSILAYSDTSPFPLDSVPSGLNLWLSETRDNIEEIRKSNTPYTGQDKVSVLVDGSGDDMIAQSEPPDPPGQCNDWFVKKGPYMSTTWNQIGGYNNMMQPLNCTPATNNGRAYTGCVATAMAQVMKYHQHPNSYSYAIMPNAVPYYDVSSGANEISRLMYNAAVSVNSTYDCSGTGAASIS